MRSAEYGMEGFGSRESRRSTTPTGGSPMTILALEFSTERRTVAVLRRVAGVSPATPGSIARADSRDTGALTLVEDALRGAGIEREAVECIAVGLGPGS